MKLKNKFKTRQINSQLLIKRMLLGAFLGLIIVSFFLFSVEEPNPNWGKFWMIRPLIILPLAGALGSLFFYSVVFISSQNRWKKVIALVLSLIVFFIALWLGAVVGFAGTLWD